MPLRGSTTTDTTGDGLESSSDPARYTVGWICAVNVEYVAAQEFLDEEHPQLAEQHQNDDNIYTLGRIGSHNVVIACLPHGSYGTGSAAAVARDVLRTFPNIKFGLMVGIGGGAPSKKQDIRLGDVVVSTVARDNGAVLQYDFGKTIQNEAFKTTGFLDAPPRLLTAAVQDLKARYERRGNGLVDSVNKVLASNRRLLKKYSRPPQTCDRLFESYFTQAVANEPCDLQCATDAEQLIVRPSRDENEDDITTVHYGLIASGNALIKDAIMRDRLAEEKGVLCFEMEAAGLMNHFKCLVIRGICDYADTHKNDDWQGYAAMAAAAYAKDLLERIPPSKVDAERSLKLAEIASDTRELKVLTTEIHAQISDKASQEQIKLARKWLSPPDPSIDFNKALRQRHQGTGQWFLDSELYQSWKSRADSFLWLYARPGCGKTVLSSTVIEHLQQRGKEAGLVLYFFFTFNDDSKQSAESMLRSLTFQLYIGVPESRSVLDEAMSAQQPGFALLCDIFAKMVHIAGPVNIVLDALDECSKKDDAVLDTLSWVKSFRTWSADVRVLVTSRDEEHIRSSLTAWVRNEETLELRSSLVSSDIRHYVFDAVRAHEGLQRWREHPEVQKEIEQALVGKADGMFRWVSCQLEVLRTCRNLPTLRVRLQKLPPTLEATYMRILENVPEEDLASSIRILQFLTYINRPMAVESLVDAIAVNLDEEPVFREENRLPDPAELSAYCPGLVSITNFGGERSNLTAQLAHSSVREWLLTARPEVNVLSQLDEFHCREAISLISMAYLTHREPSNGASVMPGVWKKGASPFESIARLEWDKHTRRVARRSQAVREMATTFCRRQGPAHSTHYGLDDLLGPTILHLEFPNDDALALAWGLLSACFYGLTFAVRHMIDEGANPAGHPECPCTPLQAATQREHTEVMELLCRECAMDVAASSAYFGKTTPLIAASGSDEGGGAIVKMLLDAGAKVNYRRPGDSGHTALTAAAKSRSLEKVRLLVDAGADVNTVIHPKYEPPATALTYACFDFNLDIAEYLIEHGALLDPQKDGKGHTVAAALRYGKWQATWEVLQRCADANSEAVRSGFGRALWQMLHEPPRYMQGERDLELIACLIDNGADFRSYSESPEKPKTTALQSVCYGFPRKEAMPFCRILLEGGADVNGSLAPKTSTPLEYACERGITELVRLLLERGAVIDRVPPAGHGRFKSALELALRYAMADYEGIGTSPLEITELLLAYGADVNGIFVGTWLLRRGSESCFESGSELESNSLSKSEFEPQLDFWYDGRAVDYEVTPLMFACRWCLPGGVALLLKHGANPNPKDAFGSPLQLACARCYPSLEDVKALLEAGAEVNIGEQTNLATPLQLVAIQSGEIEVAALLIAKGANVNAISSGEKYASAVYAAAFWQHADLVDLLLANGADPLEAELGAQAGLA